MVSTTAAISVSTSFSSLASTFSTAPESSLTSATPSFSPTAATAQTGSSTPLLSLSFSSSSSDLDLSLTDQTSSTFMTASSSAADALASSSLASSIGLTSTLASSVTIPSTPRISASSTVDLSNATLNSVTNTPLATGTQVETYSAISASATSESPSPTAEQSSSADDAYTPSQTFLIVASTASAISTSASSSESSSTFGTHRTATSTTVSPTSATIPASIPTLIVPADSAQSKSDAGTGKSDDPLKGDTLISILLAKEEYPWTFVVNSSDATSQLFNSFPTLIGSALGIDSSKIQTYGLMVYQPSGWDGTQASLLTQWLAYIPSANFDTLNSYIATQTSPLYNQTGIIGQLASQIDNAYPLSAAAGTTSTTTATSDDSDSSGSKKRNIIIGVCVGTGGLLWIALVCWIYTRVKKANEQTVKKRVTQHLSMFSDRYDIPPSEYMGDRRLSASTIAASDVDDRPSSFYASPIENGQSMQRQQQPLAVAERIPPPIHDPSVFGTSWFQNPNPANPNQRQMAQVEDPFDDGAYELSPTRANRSEAAQ
ncbi:hypothetical protein P7C73_g5074, partial [Tremellales sp. Uapishka_1]